MSYQIQIQYHPGYKWDNLFGNKVFGNKERYKTLHDALTRYGELKKRQEGTGRRPRMRIVRILEKGEEL